MKPVLYSFLVTAAAFIAASIFDVIMGAWAMRFDSHLLTYTVFAVAAIFAVLVTHSICYEKNWYRKKNTRWIFPVSFLVSGALMFFPLSVLLGAGDYYEVAFKIFGIILAAAGLFVAKARFPGSLF